MAQVMTGQEIGIIFVEVDFNESKKIEDSFGRQVSDCISSRFGLVLIVENGRDKSQFTKGNLLSGSTSIPIECSMALPPISSAN